MVRIHNVIITYIFAFAIFFGATYFIYNWYSVDTYSVNTNTGEVIRDIDSKESLSELKRAKPYIDNILTNDIEIRTQAAYIVENCENGDRECQVNEIYRWVVNNLNYLSDPRVAEVIQSPKETLSIKGGDCEDLGALLNSLLENIGIPTYIVLTDNHAYTLACDLDIEKLRKYVIEDLIEKNAKEFEKELLPNNVQYFGGDVDSGITLHYELEASSGVDIYVVPSKEEFNNIVENKGFNYFPSCSDKNVVEYKATCKLNNDGGIVIRNNRDLSIRYRIKISSIAESDVVILYYSDVFGKKCIPLDATAGKYGYPGYSASLQGEKIAIDPISENFIYLK